MRQVAVCDDDPLFLTQVQNLVLRFYGAEESCVSVFCYKDAETLLASEIHHDIYLLDILLPGMDGISLAMEIAARDRDFCVIYLTTSEEFALDAYSVDALQYLIKPLEENAFFAALKKAEIYISKSPAPARLAIPTPTGTASILLSRLCYAEYLNRNIYFHMENGEVLHSSSSSMRISDLAERLLKFPNFLRPHRSFLVNMDCIRSFSSTEIRMEHGECIPVARSGCRETRRRYMNYLLFRKKDKPC